MLDAEPDVFQVAINLAGALTLTGASAPEDAVCRTPDAGRYVLLDGVAGGPAMSISHGWNKPTASVAPPTGLRRPASTKCCASPRQPLMDEDARPPRVFDKPIRPAVTVKEPPLR